MSLNSGQQVAMASMLKWLKNGPNWSFYLGGYAGTGKTFLIQELINSLSVPPTCLAPTGKAASVLKRKLSCDVSTVHSALYKPVESAQELITRLEKMEDEYKKKADDELWDNIIKLKQKIAKLPVNFQDNEDVGIQEGSLVVVDEASMLTKKMADDLRKTGAKVLLVGDPGQLPPVGDDSYIGKGKPDALLEEVQRQALDNPIIALSMQVRLGQRIPRLIENSNIIRRPMRGYAYELLSEADQVLSGMNDMRRRINRAIRKVRGHVDLMFPQDGEKLICLRNGHCQGIWVVNGMQCEATGDTEKTPTEDYVLDINYDGTELQRVAVEPYYFQAHYRSDVAPEPYSRSRGNGLHHFDFGYAVTVHKSQGSEWNNVTLVDDELFIKDADFRRRWLYTAVTRAKEKLTWLTKE